MPGRADTLGLCRLARPRFRRASSWLRFAIRRGAAGRSSRRRQAAARRGRPPVADQHLARPRHGRVIDAGPGQRRARRLHPQFARQPDGAGRRAARSSAGSAPFMFVLVPHRHLAVVAAHRQLPPRFSLAAANSTNANLHHLPGLLDVAAAGDAVASPAPGSPFPSVFGRSKPPPGGGDRTRARGPRQPLDRAQARRRCRGRRGPPDARPAAHASPGRPIRHPSGRSALTRRAARR